MTDIEETIDESHYNGNEAAESNQGPTGVVGGGTAILAIPVENTGADQFLPFGDAKQAREGQGADDKTMKIVYDRGQAPDALPTGAPFPVNLLAKEAQRLHELSRLHMDARSASRMVAAALVQHSKDDAHLSNASLVQILRAESETVMRRPSALKDVVTERVVHVLHEHTNVLKQEDLQRLAKTKKGTRDAKETSKPAPTATSSDTKSASAEGAAGERPQSNDEAGSEEAQEASASGSESDDVSVAGEEEEEEGERANVPASALASESSDDTDVPDHSSSQSEHSRQVDHASPLLLRRPRIMDAAAHKIVDWIGGKGVEVPPELPKILHARSNLLSRAAAILGRRSRSDCNSVYKANYRVQVTLNNLHKLVQSHHITPKTVRGPLLKLRDGVQQLMKDVITAERQLAEAEAKAKAKAKAQSTSSRRGRGSARQGRRSRARRQQPPRPTSEAAPAALSARSPATPSRRAPTGDGTCDASSLAAGSKRAGPLPRSGSESPPGSDDAAPSRRARTGRREIDVDESHRRTATVVPVSAPHVPAVTESVSMLAKQADAASATPTAGSKRAEPLQPSDCSDSPGPGSDQQARALQRTGSLVSSSQKPTKEGASQDASSRRSSRSKPSRSRATRKQGHKHSAKSHSRPAVPAHSATQGGKSRKKRQQTNLTTTNSSSESGSDGQQDRRRRRTLNDESTARKPAKKSEQCSLSSRHSSPNKSTRPRRASRQSDKSNAKPAPQTPTPPAGRRSTHATEQTAGAGSKRVQPRRRSSDSDSSGPGSDEQSRNSRRTGYDATGGRKPASRGAPRDSTSRLAKDSSSRRRANRGRKPEDVPAVTTGTAPVPSTPVTSAAADALSHAGADGDDADAELASGDPDQQLGAEDGATETAEVKLNAALDKIARQSPLARHLEADEKARRHTSLILESDERSRTARDDLVSSMRASVTCLWQFIRARARQGRMQSSRRHRDAGPSPLEESVTESWPEALRLAAAASYTLPYSGAMSARTQASVVNRLASTDAGKLSETGLQLIIADEILHTAQVDANVEIDAALKQLDIILTGLGDVEGLSGQGAERIDEIVNIGDEFNDVHRVFEALQTLLRGLSSMLEGGWQNTGRNSTNLVSLLKPESGLAKLSAVAPSLSSEDNPPPSARAVGFAIQAAALCVLQALDVKNLPQSESFSTTVHRIALTVRDACRRATGFTTAAFRVCFPTPDEQEYTSIKGWADVEKIQRHAKYFSKSFRNVHMTFGSIVRAIGTRHLQRRVHAAAGSGHDSARIAALRDPDLLQLGELGDPPEVKAAREDAAAASTAMAEKWVCVHGLCEEETLAVLGDPSVQQLTLLHNICGLLFGGMLRKCDSGFKHAVGGFSDEHERAGWASKIHANGSPLHVFPLFHTNWDMHAAARQSVSRLSMSSIRAIAGRNALRKTFELDELVIITPASSVYVTDPTKIPRTTLQMALRFVHLLYQLGMDEATVNSAENLSLVTAAIMAALAMKLKRCLDKWKRTGMVESGFPLVDKARIPCQQMGYHAGRFFLSPFDKSGIWATALESDISQHLLSRILATADDMLRKHEVRHCPVTGLFHVLGKASSIFSIVVHANGTLNGHAQVIDDQLMNIDIRPVTADNGGQGLVESDVPATLHSLSVDLEPLYAKRDSLHPVARVDILVQRFLSARAARDGTIAGRSDLRAALRLAPFREAIQLAVASVIRSIQSFLKADHSTTLAAMLPEERDGWTELGLEATGQYLRMMPGVVQDRLTKHMTNVLLRNIREEPAAEAPARQTDTADARQEPSTMFKNELANALKASTNARSRSGFAQMPSLSNRTEAARMHVTELVLLSCCFGVKIGDTHMQIVQQSIPHLAVQLRFEHELPVWELAALRNDLDRSPIIGAAAEFAMQTRLTRASDSIRKRNNLVAALCDVETRQPRAQEELTAAVEAAKSKSSEVGVPRSSAGEGDGSGDDDPHAADGSGSADSDAPVPDSVLKWRYAVQIFRLKVAAMPSPHSTHLALACHEKAPPTLIVHVDLADTTDFRSLCGQVCIDTYAPIPAPHHRPKFMFFGPTTGRGDKLPTVTHLLVVRWDAALAVRRDQHWTTRVCLRALASQQLEPSGFSPAASAQLQPSPPSTCPPSTESASADLPSVAMSADSASAGAGELDLLFGQCGVVHVPGRPSERASRDTVAGIIETAMVEIHRAPQVAFACHERASPTMIVPNDLASSGDFANLVSPAGLTAINHPPRPEFRFFRSGEQQRRVPPTIQVIVVDWAVAAHVERDERWMTRICLQALASQQQQPTGWLASAAQKLQSSPPDAAGGDEQPDDAEEPLGDVERLRREIHTLKRQRTTLLNKIAALEARIHRTLEHESVVAGYRALEERLQWQLNIRAARTRIHGQAFTDFDRRACVEDEVPDRQLWPIISDERIANVRAEADRFASLLRPALNRGIGSVRAELSKIDVLRDAVQLHSLARVRDEGDQAASPDEGDDNPSQAQPLTAPAKAIDQPVPKASSEQQCLRPDDGGLPGETPPAPDRSKLVLGKQSKAGKKKGAESMRHAYEMPDPVDVMASRAFHTIHWDALCPVFNAVLKQAPPTTEDEKWFPRDKRKRAELTRGYALQYSTQLINWIVKKRTAVEDYVNNGKLGTNPVNDQLAYFFVDAEEQLTAALEDALHVLIPAAQSPTPESCAATREGLRIVFHRPQGTELTKSEAKKLGKNVEGSAWFSQRPRVETDPKKMKAFYDGLDNDSEAREEDKSKRHPRGPVSDESKHKLPLADQWLDYARNGHKGEDRLEFLRTMKTRLAERVVPSSKTSKSAEQARKLIVELLNSIKSKAEKACSLRLSAEERRSISAAERKPGDAAALLKALLAVPKSKKQPELVLSNKNDVDAIIRDTQKACLSSSCLRGNPAGSKIYLMLSEFYPVVAYVEDKNIRTEFKDTVRFNIREEVTLAPRKFGDTIRLPDGTVARTARVLELSERVAHAAGIDPGIVSAIVLSYVTIMAGTGELTDLSKVVPPDPPDDPEKHEVVEDDDMEGKVEVGEDGHMGLPANPSAHVPKGHRYIGGVNHDEHSSLQGMYKTADKKNAAKHMTQSKNHPVMFGFRMTASLSVLALRARGSISHHEVVDTDSNANTDSRDVDAVRSAFEGNGEDKPTRLTRDVLEAAEDRANIMWRSWHKRYQQWSAKMSRQGKAKWHNLARVATESAFSLKHLACTKELSELMLRTSRGRWTAKDHKDVMGGKKRRVIILAVGDGGHLAKTKTHVYKRPTKKKGGASSRVAETWSFAGPQRLDKYLEKEYCGVRARFLGADGKVSEEAVIAVVRVNEFGTSSKCAFCETWKDNGGARRKSCNNASCPLHNLIVDRDGAAAGAIIGRLLNALGYTHGPFQRREIASQSEQRRNPST